MKDQNYSLDTIKFREDDVQVVVDTRTDEKWVPVKRLCENLGLSYRSQFEKVKNDRKFNHAVISIVAGDGRTREMLSIPAKRIGAFLFSINANRVREDLREKLLDYQFELADALHDYSTKGIAVKGTEGEVTIATQALIMAQALVEHENRLNQVESDIEEIRSFRQTNHGKHVRTPNEVYLIEDQIAEGIEVDVSKPRHCLDTLMKFVGQYHPGYNNYWSTWQSLADHILAKHRISIHKTKNEGYMQRIATNRRTTYGFVYEIAYNHFDVGRMV